MKPNSEQSTYLARHGKTIFLVVFFFLSLTASAQICDCPLPTACSPCRGGLTKLTLRLTTIFPYMVTATDQSGPLFSGMVGGGNTFTLTSSRPNDKFQGPDITIRVGGFSAVNIKTGCTSDAEIGKRFGNVEIVAAESKEGGAICCKESDRDNDPPEINNMPTNRSVNLSTAGTGSCSAIARWTEPTSRDNCDVTSFTSNVHSGDAFPIGNTTVTYTAIDKMGNKRERSFTVTVVDDVPPNITDCPGSFNVTATGSCAMAVTWTPPGVTDCSAVTLTSTHNPGALLPVGKTTKVTYTARDARGKTSECTFDIHVSDGKPLTFINCPSDITVEENSACETVVTWTPPTVSDNCGNPVVKASHKPGAKFRLGDTRVEYTITEPKGIESVCSFTVHVTTSATPVVTGCPPEPIRIQANELGEAEATWQEPHATIACGDVPVERSHTPGSIFNIGTTPVVYTFGQGDHTATCSFDVIVSPPDITIDIGKAVTPNGDGIHDYWEIVPLEKYKDNAVLVIDRWGNKIYEASGYDNERVRWDGRSQQGVKVPTGTYFYTVEVRVQGIVWKRKGSVEVIQP